MPTMKIKEASELGAQQVTNQLLRELVAEQRRTNELLASIAGAFRPVPA